MLLKQLKVKNIRSYQEEVILFPSGSTILSGDIGCGKSSLLLAIEFALFGTARPDLPGSALLRKGATQGFAELTFSLNHKEIIVKRNLKKEKNTVKQLPGSLIIEGVETELMPVELKAKIITLLGYPDDLLSKNKNYIFRYTIYTPQEEMKLILQENAENRLDVLRKIFGIDKYKVIRENSQLYLKSMRTSIAVRKTRLEPLEEMTLKINEIKQQIQEKQALHAKLLPKKQEIMKLREAKQEMIKVIETQKQEFITIREEEKALTQRINDKQEFLQTVIAKRERTQAEISKIAVAEGMTEEKIRQEVKELETNIEKISNNKNKQELEIKKIQEEISQLRDQKEKLHQKVQQEGSLLAEKRKLEEIVKRKEEVMSLQENLETQKTTVLQEVSKHKIIVEEGALQNENLQKLETCPTCLQQVDHNHKETILAQNQSKISQSTQILRRNEEELTQLSNKQIQCKEELASINESYAALQRILVSLTQMNEWKSEFESVQKKVKELVMQNNSLMQTLSNNETSQRIEHLKIQREQRQQFLSQIISKKHLSIQLKEVEMQITKTREEILSLQVKKEEIVKRRETLKDPSSMLEEEKKKERVLQETEKEISLQERECRVMLETFQRQSGEIQTQLDKLHREKELLEKDKGLYHWLEKYFLNLTYTIEKHVMLHIHSLFNQLFQEWFSILIDDDSMGARLDETFSPIIEQNGYEIEFSNLSGGERTSASLAYRLALNRVINDVVHDIKTKDVLILDEPTDGFSDQQLDKVRDVLEKLNLRQTIIVSHESKIESFMENIIRVRKQGHVSFVE